MGRIFNRVAMSVSGTPGTGAVTVGSALTGFQSFASAGVADGDVVSYAIEDGPGWEVGQGTYASSGTVLTRTLILGSSNSNTALNLTSGARVFVTSLSVDAAFQSPISAGAGTLNLAVAQLGAPIVCSSTAGQSATTINLPSSGVPVGARTGSILNNTTLAGGNQTVVIKVTNTQFLNGILGGTITLNPLQKGYVFYAGNGAWHFVFEDRFPTLLFRDLGGVNTFDFSIPVGWSILEVTAWGLQPSVASYFGYRLYDGSTLRSGTSDYQCTTNVTNVNASSIRMNYYTLTVTGSAITNYANAYAPFLHGHIETTYGQYNGTASYVNGTATPYGNPISSAQWGSNAAMKNPVYLRFGMESGDTMNFTPGNAFIEIKGKA